MRIPLSTPLGNLREQLPPVLASWIHGVGVGVECLHASQHAVQVVCKSRTLVVHPCQCNVLMLMLASELLANRRQIRSAAEPAKPDTVRGWLRDARTRLVARFPAFEGIQESAWQACEADHLLPVMRWHDAKVDPPRARQLMPNERGRRGVLDTTATEVVLPDCELDGAGDALADMLAAIADGSQPLQWLPELPDCPFVVMQVRLGNRVDSPRGLSEVIRHRTGLLGASRAIAHCVRTSTEGLPLDHPADANAFYGLDLDMGRLADARIATKLGRDFPVFAREEDPLSTFDPTQHRAVIYSDLTEHETDLRDAAPSLHISATIAHGYELLGIETEWHACLDFLTPGPQDKPVVLHLDFVIKRFDEPWAPIVWERLKRVHEFRPVTETKAAVLPPLHMRRAIDVLGQVGDDVGPNGWWHAILLMGPNMQAMKHVTRAPVRFAADMERTLRTVKERCNMKPMLWLPKTLSTAIDRDSPLREGLIRAD